MPRSFLDISASFVGTSDIDRDKDTRIIIPNDYLMLLVSMYRVSKLGVKTTDKEIESKRHECELNRFDSF